MATRLITALVVFSIIFSSCSKSADKGNTGGNTQNPPPNYLRHTIHFSQVSSSGSVEQIEAQVFNYDKPNNTITVYQYDTLPGGTFGDTITYKLDGDVINISHTLSTRTGQKYFLNHAHTAADSVWNLDGTKKYVYIYTYTFNTAGQLTATNGTNVNYNNGVVTSTNTLPVTNITWVNGNFTRSANSQSISTYTYDETVLAAAPDPILDLFSIQQHLLQSKNIVKTGTVTIFGSDLNLTYTYDSQGRVVKLTGVSSKTGDKTLNEFTYY